MFWMVERGERLRLAAETCQAFRVAATARAGLQRHLAIQIRVARAIDLAHPAGAQRAEDFVRAEASAGGEGH